MRLFKRQTTRVFIASLVSVLLSACTLFTAQAMKDAAKDVAKNNLRAVLRTEVDTVLSEKHQRANDFVEYMVKHSDFEIQRVVEIDSNTYMVDIKVTTISPEMRKTVLEIISKMDPRKLNAFNFTEGLQLIKSQKPDTEMNSISNINLVMRKKGDTWGP